MKKAMVISVVLIGLVANAFCIDESKVKPEQGVYTLVSVDGSNIPTTVSHGDHDVKVFSGSFTINDDGTCVSKVAFGSQKNIRTVKATYTREGATLNMQWKGAGKTKGTLKGDTFTMNNEGMLFAYKKQAAAIKVTVVEPPKEVKETAVTDVEKNGDGEIAKEVDINKYLAKGAYKEGIKFYSDRVSKSATSEDVFSLGTMQFLRGIEELTQSMYDLGLKSQQNQLAGVPFFRLPIPENPNPREITAKDTQLMFLKFEQSMKIVNQTLSNLPEKEFKVTVNLGHVRMDFNADGKVTDDEQFHSIYSVFNRRAAREIKKNSAFPITFDLGDAYWLKGYSHVLMAMCDMILAHDRSKFFEYCGHMVFANPKTPYKDLFTKKQSGNYADGIAFIHLWHLPVVQPERYASARNNLKGMIECSRMSWKHINQETDDDREWVPNVKQKSVTGARINAQMIDGWMMFLNEFEQILDGEKRVKHWRTGDKVGINFKKFFEEPPAVFDLVLWIQGSAAKPYLEEGPLSEPATWNQMTSLFRGNFIGFMIWVN